MNSPNSLEVSYDRHADVLYLAVGEPVPAFVDEDDDGLLVRVAQSDGHPCGVTVLRASRWLHSSGARLASLVGEHLHLPVKEVAEALSIVRG